MVLYRINVLTSVGITGQISSYTSSGLGNTESISNRMWNLEMPLSYDTDPDFDLEGLLQSDQQGFLGAT